MPLNPFGYFEDASDTPAFDPGLDIDCPICHTKLSPLLRAFSFMVPGDSRSYFFRTHQACAELHPEMVADVESSLVDAIYRSRENN